LPIQSREIAARDLELKAVPRFEAERGRPTIEVQPVDVARNDVPGRVVAGKQVTCTDNSILYVADEAVTLTTESFAVKAEDRVNPGTLRISPPVPS
jgi:hypothetical protein